MDSIREVIRQVRAKQQPEILLMTPAFGFEGSDFIKEWTYAVKPDVMNLSWVNVPTHRHWQAGLPTLFCCRGGGNTVLLAGSSGRIL